MTAQSMGDRYWISGPLFLADAYLAAAARLGVTLEFVARNRDGDDFTAFFMSATVPPDVLCGEVAKCYAEEGR